MNYSELKSQMQQLIRVANSVIAETEKETPDDTAIMDLAIEELDELSCQIDTTVFWKHTSIFNNNVSKT